MEVHHTRRVEQLFFTLKSIKLNLLFFYYARQFYVLYAIISYW